MSEQQYPKTPKRFRNAISKLDLSPEARRQGERVALEMGVKPVNPERVEREIAKFNELTTGE